MAGKKKAPYGPLRSGLNSMRTASVMDPDAPDEITEIGNKVWPGQYGPVQYANGGTVQSQRPAWDIFGL